jgi:uncharacterized membrane-anchored protein
MSLTEATMLAANPPPQNGSPGKTAQRTRQFLNKVPEITLYFWLIKILCTTVGETISDLLNVDLGFGLDKTGLVMGAALIAALTVQFWYRKYVPWIYWLVVVLISIVGTIITDKLHDGLGIALSTLTIAFSVALAIVFGLWYTVEKTLSIRTITTRRRESFYWTAILATFALGTAAGDYLLETLQDALGGPTGRFMGMDGQRAGLLISGAIFAVVILGAAVAHLKFKVNPVLAFWIAYIFTRPFGANIGDFLGGDPALPPDEFGNPGPGGLGIGAPIISAVFLAAILASIIYLTLTKKDQTPDPHFIVETHAEQTQHQRK